jgi:bifunctional non-homologous end joining protein LigD
MSRAPAATCDLEIEGRQLRLTNTDRVLWSRAGFTKGNLIDYYSAVAPALLPHLVNRPVTLVRWPHGVDARGFAQSECRGQPDWMRVAELRLRSGEVRRHCLIDDAASLVWVANLAAIELHTYQFPFEHPNQPTAALLDLDPGPAVSVPELAHPKRQGLLREFEQRRCAPFEIAAARDLLMPFSRRPSYCLLFLTLEP